VKPVARVNGGKEAIRVANDTEYGLSAAVFSRDVQRALTVAERIASGIDRRTAALSVLKVRADDGAR
jgi:acyl-CoA reductase-like NAD-dependent aldehyde dehydrogenase